VLTLGLGPPSGVSIGRLSGVGALWDCVPHVCGGGRGCAGGGVLLGDVPVLSRCGGVFLDGIFIIISVVYPFYIHKKYTTPAHLHSYPNL